MKPQIQKHHYKFVRLGEGWLTAGQEAKTTYQEAIYKARRNLENEMLAYAKRAARDGETAEQALVRLIDARDPQVASMYNATSIMKQIESPSCSREQAEAIMEQMAKAEATRTGVGQHEAAASLLRDSADYRKAYSIYVGLE